MIMVLGSLNLFSLKFKRALITGATGHLGTDMSQALAEAGATVILNGRNKDNLLKLHNKLKNNGLVSEISCFDITKATEIIEFCNKEHEKPIDIIVNNAYHGGAGTIEYSSLAQFRESYETGIVAVQNLVQSLLPNLRHAVVLHGGASVINIASMYGMVSPDLSIYDNPEVSNPPFYGAVKAALIQWTRYAACEFGKEKIRFNTISPGPFPNNSAIKNTKFIQKLTNKVPMKRIGKPYELGGPLVFLASEASSFVNGANIVVDGGWTIK